MEGRLLRLAGDRSPGVGGVGLLVLLRVPAEAAEAAVGTEARRGRREGDPAGPGPGGDRLGKQVEQRQRAQSEQREAPQEELDLLQEIGRAAEQPAQQPDRAEEHRECERAHRHVDHDLQPGDRRADVARQQDRPDEQGDGHRRDQLGQVHGRAEREGSAAERRLAEEQLLDVHKDADGRRGDHEPRGRFTESASLDIDHNYPQRVLG
nr:hypothetical protein GCM10020093_092850 [Planobispora longispora]